MHWAFVQGHKLVPISQQNNPRVEDCEDCGCDKVALTVSLRTEDREQKYVMYEVQELGVCNA